MDRIKFFLYELAVNNYCWIEWITYVFGPMIST
jgi:hypothetical protein